MTTATDYNKQATDFLTATCTEFKATYLKTAKYFHDDTETRDIYKISLKNSRGEYSFKFGQSLANSKENRTAPSPYDVLACLTKGDPGEYTDFCLDFGYDKCPVARSIYNAVVKEYSKICALFNESELEQLQEIN